MRFGFPATEPAGFRTHSSTESSYAPVLARLEERLTRAETIAARQHAGRVAAQFKLPSGNATNSSFVTSVKTLIVAAEGQKELLVQEWMSATLLDELTKMVAEFEIILEAVRTARRERIGARAVLEEWQAVKQVLGVSPRGVVVARERSDRGNPDGVSTAPGGIAPAA